LKFRLEFFLNLRTAYILTSAGSLRQIHQPADSTEWQYWLLTIISC